MTEYVQVTVIQLKEWLPTQTTEARIQCKNMCKVLKDKWKKKDKELSSQNSKSSKKKEAFKSKGEINIFLDTKIWDNMFQEAWRTTITGKGNLSGWRVIIADVSSDLQEGGIHRK